MLRALLLQVLYSVRSERLLMEQLQYNLVFRWFVGLSMDDHVWDVTVFTKNRDRLLRGDVAVAFFQRVLELARADRLLSDEHFSVDGTLAVMPEGVEHARNPGEWYEEERVPTAVMPKGAAPDGHVLPAPVSQLGADCRTVDAAESSA